MTCPYDPVPLKGAPIGMLHCPECGQMILAGVPHLDYDALPPELPGYEDDMGGVGGER